MQNKPAGGASQPPKIPVEKKPEPKRKLPGDDEGVWEQRFAQHLQEWGPLPPSVDALEGLQQFKRSWREGEKNSTAGQEKLKKPRLGPFAGVPEGKIPRGCPGGDLNMDDSCGNFP